MAAHPIVHIELSANNCLSASKFYQDVFGWEITQIPEMSYATFMSQKELGGGFNPVTPENPAGTVTVYIGTDDIDASLAQVNAAGGKTVAPMMEIPGVGWFALFKDPTGNTMALFKSLTEMPS